MLSFSSLQQRFGKDWVRSCFSSYFGKRKGAMGWFWLLIRDLAGADSARHPWFWLSIRDLAGADSARPPWSAFGRIPQGGGARVKIHHIYKVLGGPAATTVCSWNNVEWIRFCDDRGYGKTNTQMMRGWPLTWHLNVCKFYNDFYICR